MTFQNFDEFLKFVIETDGITLQETNPPEDNHNWLVLEDLRNSDPIILAEVLISAYDSGYHFGSFYADRYDGMLTISE